LAPQRLRSRNHKLWRIDEFKLKATKHIELRSADPFRIQAGGRSEGRAQPVSKLGVFALGFVPISAPALEVLPKAGADVPDLRKRYWGGISG